MQTKTDILQNCNEVLGHCARYTLLHKTNDTLFTQVRKSAYRALEDYVDEYDLYPFEYLAHFKDYDQFFDELRGMGEDDFDSLDIYDILTHLTILKGVGNIICLSEDELCEYKVEADKWITAWCDTKFDVLDSYAQR